MALKPCRSCAHEVDPSAKTCPNCGVASPVTNPVEAVFSVLVMVVVLIVGANMCSGSSDEKKPTAEPEIDDTTCMKDLECWGNRHSATSVPYCKRAVERLAKYDARWTDGFLEPKFGRFRWANPARGVVTYIGDSVEFQNGFGAYQPHVYECDFDPRAKIVKDARARPGRR